MEAIEKTTRRNPAALLPTGTTPATRGLEKQQQALGWLLRWHFSTNAIVCEMLGIRDSGYLAKLAKRGLVEKVFTPTLATGAIYVLTESGLWDALADLEDLIPYPHDALRLNHKLLRHSLCVQRTVVRLQGLQEAIPERLLITHGKAGEKMPDALILTDKTTPHWAALEIELTPKYERELDQTMLAHVLAMERGDYAFVIYMSQSEALLNRYKRHLEKPIQCWVKDAAAQKWKTSKMFSVPSELLPRFVVLPDAEIFKGL